MSLTIQQLPIDAVHLIGAGEVIDSLAAVVRELAENAIDAGATRVAIALDLSRWAVRVADNGQGMSVEDLQQAACPHTTSKIQGSQDLNAITSLGFRGEALHSLAQLADLEISSHQAHAEEGWHIRYSSQGTVLTCESVAIAPGTIVSVMHVFASWLKRRDVMPSEAQQLRQVQRMIQHLSLCHPHITWTVSQREKEWFSVFPGDTAKRILPQFLRDVQPEDLQEQTQYWSFDSLSGETEQLDDDDVGITERPFLDLGTGPSVNPTDNVDTVGNSEQGCERTGQLYILLGLPDRCHRRRADWIKVAVNGRMIQCSELEQSIIGAFRRTLQRDRYPVCFVHLTVPVGHVDWNRHPAKQEVYLHHMAIWQDRIRRAIAHIFSLHTNHVSDPYFARRLTQLISAAEPNGSYRVGDETQMKSVEPNSQSSVLDDDNQILNDSQEMPTLAGQEDVLGAPLTSLRAIAQVHQMYILAEHPEGMWLIEQHIAHERVLYEQLCKQWQLIPIEPPIILRQLSVAQCEQLHRLNVDVEPFGENLWAARTVPAALAQRDDCREALLELSLGGDVDAALVATACRTAIRNGTPLNRSQMQILLNEWQQTRNPRTCPHGRPIYLRLEESRLSRFFRRHWVIGKSHGI